MSKKIPPEKLATKLPEILVQIEANSLPPPFHVIDVPGATKTVARGINSRRIVVGTYWTDSAFKQRHGFRYNPSSGVYDTFDVPAKFVARETVNKGSTGAAGINDKGYIVGDFATDKGDYGYRLRPWPTSEQYELGANQPSVHRLNIVDLRYADDDLIERVGGPSNAASIGTHATCINNDLYIGGRIFAPRPFGDSAEVHGFVLTGGDPGRAWVNYRRIDARHGWNLTEIYGINSYRGDINFVQRDLLADVVGVTSESVSGTKAGAFIRYNATADVPPFPQPDPTVLFEPQDQLPVTFSRARGINSGREVVGQYTTSTDEKIAVQARPGRGFIRDFNQQNAPSIPIDVPVAADWHSFWFGPTKPAKSTYAHGINDDGYVVGEFAEVLADGTERTHGFIRHPVLWYLWLLALGITRRETEEVRNFPEPRPIPVPRWFWEKRSRRS